MRPPRFRIRTLMIAVAAAGVAFATVPWAARMQRRRIDYLATAAEHSKRARRLAVYVTPSAAQRNPRLYPVYERTWQRYRDLEWKYRLAARRPWLPVPPDPRPPE